MRLPNTVRLSPLQWFVLLLLYQYVVGAWLYLNCFRRTSARDFLCSMSEVMLIEDHISAYKDLWCLLIKQSIALGLNWADNESEFHCFFVKLLPLCIWHMCKRNITKQFEVWNSSFSTLDFEGCLVALDSRCWSAIPDVGCTFHGFRPKFILHTCVNHYWLSWLQQRSVRLLCNTVLFRWVVHSQLMMGPVWFQVALNFRRQVFFSIVAS